MTRPAAAAIPSSRLRGDAVQPPAPASSPGAGPSTTRAPAPAPRAVASTSFYSKPAAKVSPKKKLHIGSVALGKDVEAWGGALHDPNAFGAVVMERPPEEEARQRLAEPLYPRADSRGTTINDVVLDPMLAKRMREHQKEGVKVSFGGCS